MSDVRAFGLIGDHASPIKKIFTFLNFGVYFGINWRSWHFLTFQNLSFLLLYVYLRMKIPPTNQIDMSKY